MAVDCSEAPMRCTSFAGGLLALVVGMSSAWADVDFQSLSSRAVRVNDALKLLREPLPPVDEKALPQAASGSGGAAGVTEIQRILDRYCLLIVNINPASRV